MRKVSSGPKIVSIGAGNHRAEVIAARNKLVEDNLGLVRPIAQSLARGLPPSFQLDDLVSEGYVGLISAATRFRKGKAPFEVYAKWRIRGAILDSVRRNYRNNTNLSADRKPRGPDDVYMQRSLQRDFKDVEDPSDDAKASSELELSIDHGRLALRLNGAITVLPERLQNIIRLHYGEDELKLAEIAHIIGIRDTSARRLHARAVNKLRPILLRALLDPAA